MNDQLMLRNYSPDAFNWLMMCCPKDTNRRYDSNRERSDLKEICCGSNVQCRMMDP